MKYYEAPDYSYKNDNDLINEDYKCIFLGGSITGAWDWQLQMSTKLSGTCHVFNPRRYNFDVNNPEIEREQITWEFDTLKFCPMIMFYFSEETLAPITLFEYGKMINDPTKKLFVCVHPEYKRKNDVLIQTELSYPSLAKDIRFDLNDTYNDIILYMKGLNK